MEFTKEQLALAASIIEEGGRRIVLSRALNISHRQAMNLLSRMAAGEFKDVLGPEAKRTKTLDKIQQYIDMNLTPYQVALETGVSMATTRNNILKLDPSYSPVEADLRKEAVDGITFGRLQREYDFRTLKEAIDAIEMAFPGSYCSTIVADSSRPEDMLLRPVLSNADKFEKFAAKREERKFQYFVSPEEDYLHVKIDDNLAGDEIQIFNFTDVHFGSKFHRTEVFDRCLDIVKQSPNRFLFDGGDTTESITKASVANPMEQFLTNNQQIDYATDKYGEVVDKMFCKIWGNHCGGRFEKTAELDAARLIAQRLRVPYFRHRVIIDVEWRRRLWTIFLTHTWNKAHTQDAVVREVKKVYQDYPFPIHFFCSGHNHNAFIQPDDVNKKVDGKGLMKMRYHIVNGGSFLAKTGSYATEYSDCPQDLTFLRLREDGSYLAAAIPILSL